MPAKPHKGTRMKPNSIALLTLGVSLLALSANGQDRLTREEYIQKYKSLAVEEIWSRMYMSRSRSERAS